MKTVVNTLTGVVLFSISSEEESNIEIKSHETVINSVCELEFDSETEIQVWNFDEKKFEIKPKN